MKNADQLALSSHGRMLLHVACLLRGGNRRFHWAGIRREWRLRRGIHGGYQPGEGGKPQ